MSFDYQKLDPWVMEDLLLLTKKKSGELTEDQRSRAGMLLAVLSMWLNAGAPPPEPYVQPPGLRPEGQ